MELGLGRHPPGAHLLRVLGRLLPPPCPSSLTQGLWAGAQSRWEAGLGLAFRPSSEAVPGAGLDCQLPPWLKAVCQGGAEGLGRCGQYLCPGLCPHAGLPEGWVRVA